MVRAEDGGKTTPTEQGLCSCCWPLIREPPLVRASDTADPGVGVGGHCRGAWRAEGQDAARTWSQVMSSHVAAILLKNGRSVTKRKEMNRQQALTGCPALR